MAFSKEARIKVFIVVDLIFFLLEITIGYAAHSLALVADAFHMLNDIISLCVGLWAVRVATNRSSSTEYTYGWARAEILGGLINGVFLIALCLSIFLEAIQRIVEPQEVSNPKLVLIVGGIGLAFNILGLFVFHQHDHGDEHDHDHGAGDDLAAAESGQGHSHVHSHSEHDGHQHQETSSTVQSQTKSKSIASPQKSERETAIKWQDPSEANESTPLIANRTNSVSSRRNFTGIVRSGSRSSGRPHRIDGVPIHPASFRNEFVTQARYGDGDDEESDSESASGEGNNGRDASSEPFPEHPEGNGNVVSHSGHKHTQPRSKAAGGGHSHGDMNIRGMFLHVLGDALGNVGVMASALIIWLTTSPYRFYADPIISLFITLIILKSAIPLCKETAKPLLQAVPKDISVNDIQDDIESLPGVRSCHHLHVWALTPSKRIATLDVQMDFDYDVVKYMTIAKEIKNCLRGYGIHSSTIQPEFLGPTGLCQLDGCCNDPDMTCCTPPESGTATPSGAAANHTHK